MCVIKYVRGVNCARHYWHKITPYKQGSIDESDGESEFKVHYRRQETLLEGSSREPVGLVSVQSASSLKPCDRLKPHKRWNCETEPLACLKSLLFLIMAESPELTSSLECIVCSDSFKKLKQLSCNHAFCCTCLEQIRQGHRIKCPYCRQETELSPFGVGDLPGQFAGTLECTECQENVELQEMKWCADCKTVLCR